MVSLWFPYDQPINPPLQWDLPKKNPNQTPAPPLRSSGLRLVGEVTPLLRLIQRLRLRTLGWRPKVNTWEIYGGFHKLRDAKWWVYSRKSICKWMIWGYPHFRKSYVYIYIYIHYTHIYRKYVDISRTF